VNEKLVENIFSNINSFEKEVLEVYSATDRSDIMRIMTKIVVCDILKEHLNFLYLNNISNFSLKQIPNIIFKEIANEWVSYAIDILDYTKEEALEILTPKNILFIKSLSLNYYKNYKEYIFEEIAESFIELLSSAKVASKRVMFVNSVINSDFIANRNSLGINSFNQLHKNVKSAKNIKNASLRVLQVKISDILKDLSDPELNEIDENILSDLLKSHEEKLEQLKHRSLASFDANLERVKRAIINSLKRGMVK
jgi:hypothetical protein